MPVTTEMETRPTAHPLDDRLRRVIACHFDPAGGSRFWLDRQARLGLDARDEILTVADLPKLGEVSAADLAHTPMLDLIPRRFHAELGRFVLAQTGGTTGPGLWTAYREDEFHEAFVAPFVAAADHTGFPRGAWWLYIGPSGPHIIGRAAAHLARATDSPEPFSVDFDPRWAKRLPEDSFARKRYLDHVVEQAMEIIRTQSVEVVFTTPVVLEVLSRRMTTGPRMRIRGVHYGGMAITPEQMGRLQQKFFPRAVHLSGYGNTLFGCCLELNTAPGRSLEYYPFGDRLLFETVDDDGNEVSAGQPGRVRFTRLDESMLIVRFTERDVATLTTAPPDALDGFRLPGLRDPHTPERLVPRTAVGLY